MFNKKQPDVLKKVESRPVDRMALLIARVIKRMQELFVQLMNAAVKKMGVSYSKIVFAIVFSATGLYSLYLTGAALFEPNNGIQLFAQTSIQQPEFINQIENGEALIEHDSATARKLKQFILYFDSIQQSQPIQYDSILQSRPGLIDSIRMLHQIYYSQQKNKAYEK